MLNILSYLGMSAHSEVCLWTLLGLLRTIFDATLFKVNANLKEVWQMSMPRELTLPVQRVLRTVISGVMLVKCFSLYIYLASYIVLLYPVFLEERPNLVLPWLLLAAVRMLLCELVSIAMGLGVCALLGPARPPCIRFVVVKFGSIMPTFYMWMLMYSYYHSLKMSSLYKSFSAARHPDDSDFGLELAVRRRKTKSLFNENQLRKRLLTNFYNEESIPALATITSRTVSSSNGSSSDNVDPLNMCPAPSRLMADLTIDLEGIDITAPRNADRILEQFIMMMLKIGSILNRGGINADLLQNSPLLQDANDISVHSEFPLDSKGIKEEIALTTSTRPSTTNFGSQNVSDSRFSLSAIDPTPMTIAPASDKISTIAIKNTTNENVGLDSIKSMEENTFTTSTRPSLTNFGSQKVPDSRFSLSAIDLSLMTTSRSTDKISTTAIKDIKNEIVVTDSVGIKEENTLNASRRSSITNFESQKCSCSCFNLSAIDPTLITTASSTDKILTTAIKNTKNVGLVSTGTNEENALNTSTRPSSTNFGSPKCPDSCSNIFATDPMPMNIAPATNNMSTIIAIKNVTHENVGLESISSIEENTLTMSTRPSSTNFGSHKVLNSHFSLPAIDPTPMTLSSSTDEISKAAIKNVTKENAGLDSRGIREEEILNTPRRQSSINSASQKKPDSCLSLSAIDPTPMTIAPTNVEISTIIPIENIINENLRPSVNSPVNTRSSDGYSAQSISTVSSKDLILSQLNKSDGLKECNCHKTNYKSTTTIESITVKRAKLTRIKTSTITYTPNKARDQGTPNIISSSTITTKVTSDEADRSSDSSLNT